MCKRFIGAMLVKDKRGSRSEGIALHHDAGLTSTGRGKGVWVGRISNYRAVLRNFGQADGVFLT